jgi:hypothetical protein
MRQHHVLRPAAAAAAAGVGVEIAHHNIQRANFQHQLPWHAAAATAAAAAEDGVDIATA